MQQIFDMQAADYADVADPTGFDPQCLQHERADQHFAALDNEQRIRARCSIWWRDTARLDGTATGAVGHYAATDGKYAAAVLQHASRELKNRGCGYAIGPLDGNTWRRYRFVTERGSARPFYLEPDNPDDWPLHFAAAGFSSIANYISEVNPDIANRQPELGTLREKFSGLGVHIGPVAVDDPVDDMAGIYRVVCDSFRRAFLYTPLDVDSFCALYEPLLRQVDPRLMLVARRDGEVVGFIFAPPDYLQQAYRRTMDTIVLKTVAVLPGPDFSGLGRVLIVDLLTNALDMGFSTAISALMYAGNRSQAISSDCAGPMRGYALFAKELSP